MKPWERDTPLVWQNFALFPFLTVTKNVEFGLKMRKVEKAERRSRSARPSTRSGSASWPTVDRAALGRPEAAGRSRAGAGHRPEVLLLDEPLGSLDAHLRVRMQSELRVLQRELGITFVYVTHNQSEALAMADRIVVMDLGQIQQAGPPQEVYRRPHNRFVAEFVGTNNILSGTVTAVEAGRHHVATPTGDFTVHARTASPAVGEEASFVIAADRITTAYEGELAGEPCRREADRRGVRRRDRDALPRARRTAPNSSFQKQEHQIAPHVGRARRPLRGSWDPEAAYLLPNP